MLNKESAYHFAKYVVKKLIINFNEYCLHYVRLVHDEHVLCTNNYLYVTRSKIHASKIPTDNQHVYLFIIHKILGKGYIVHVVDKCSNDIYTFSVDPYYYMIC